MTTRSRHFRAWWAQAWRCVLHTTQAMAATEAMVGLGLTDQHLCRGPHLYPAVPVGWADCALIAAPEAWWVQRTDWADGPSALRIEVAPHAVTEPLHAFTPTEWARLHALRDRYRANHGPATSRELAHLQFVRWLHHTGRITA